MAYVSPSDRTTGDLISAATWNQDVVANGQADLRVVQRQGGDATDWQTAGTSDYNIKAATSLIQAGVVTVDFADTETEHEVVVTLPESFSAIPIALGSLGSYSGFFLYLTITATAVNSLTILLKRPSSTGTESVDVSWLAIGPG